VNLAKADLDSDRGNNLTVSASFIDTSPHCARYRLMCSIIEMFSLPKNFAKSGTYTEVAGAPCQTSPDMGLDRCLPSP
jgi:hypothetical protein